MMPKRVLVFDEDERQLRISKELLTKGLAGALDFVIEAEKPFADKAQYLHLLTDSKVACIVIDQRLRESGEVNYSGIELARYLRSHNPLLPIYILSNFAGEADEFSGNEWSVEDIFDKKDLGTDSGLKTISHRISRRAASYFQTLDEREARFTTLLKKSLESDLAQAEMEELQELHAQRTYSLNVSEIPLLLELQKSIEKIEKLSEDLKKPGHGEAS